MVSHAMNHGPSIQTSGPPAFLRHTLVLIPALNEEACLAETIRCWLDLGAARVRIVDNGSTDRTADAARNAGAEVLFESQRGYGAAVWRGLQDWPEDAGLDWVLFSSADGSDRLTIQEAHEWQRALEAGADLVLGDRTSGQAAPPDLKLVQRLGNRFVCQALRVGWGQRFRDMGSMRLIRHRALMSLGLKDRGFGWNVEMQIRALERGWSLVELPVTYHPRRAGKSKISGNVSGTLRAGWGILRMLGKMWQWRWQPDRECIRGLPAPKPRPPI